MAYDKNHFVISIHAPTRGATISNNRLFTDESFQSTLPRGERPPLVRKRIYLQQFQSTLPRGERREFLRLRSILSDFNPRSHEGSDSRRILQGGRSGISIHAPTRGATVLSVVLIVGELFQSTLPRGERRMI